MARHLRLDLRGKSLRAGLQISQMPVKCWQPSARADHPQLHFLASLLAKEIFHRFHQLSAQAGSLSSRMDRKQPEVPAFTAQFSVNATSQALRVFSNQKFSLSQIREHTVSIDPIASKNRPLHLKRRINQPHQRRGILLARNSRRQRTFHLILRHSTRSWRLLFHRSTSLLFHFSPRPTPEFSLPPRIVLLP
jgi:hypothetical protein